MNINIGEKIAELRKMNKVTQEELSKTVGITVQAVSKWECGGSPDIELLPRIADFFNVSIDELFSREVKTSVSMEQIAEYLSNYDVKERFEKIMDLMWAVRESFLYKKFHEPGSKINTFNEVINDVSDSKSPYSRMIYNEGITLMRLGKALNYFFVLPEDSERIGYTNRLGYNRKYLNLFKILGTECGLKIFYYIHSKQEAFHINDILRLGQGKAEEAENILKELEDMQLIIKREKDGITKYYPRPSPAFIALLVFADEIINFCYGENCNFRDKPYLKEHMMF